MNKPEQPRGDALQAIRHTDEPAEPALEPAGAKLEIHLGCLRSTLIRSGQLFVEALLVPGLLFALVLHYVGLFPALGASLGWCYLVVGTRWIRGRRLSGTMLMCLGMMSGRAIVALATSSALLYLMQPVVGSVCTASMFV